MNKDELKLIESKLYNYFQKDKKIAAINYKIETLMHQIDGIDRDLRECNIDIELESSAMSFEERVQTSNDGTSYAERQAIKVTELKLQRKADKELEIEQLKTEIENIELDNAILDFNLKDLNREYYKILELRYGRKKNETEISLEMNISQSSINRIKQKTLEDIKRWDDWRK